MTNFLSQHKINLLIVLLVAIFLIVIMKVLPSNSNGIPRDEKVRSDFFNDAKAGNWYIYEGAIFQPLVSSPQLFVFPDKPEEEVKTVLDGKGIVNLAVSPDGKLLVGNTNGDLAENVYLQILYVNENNQLQSSYSNAEITGVRTHENGPGSGYQWSPNQEYVSFVQKTSLRLLNTNTYTITTLAEDHPTNDQDTADHLNVPMWLDNEHVIYQANDGMIKKINIATNEKTNIVKGVLPSVSKNGKFMIFMDPNTATGGDFYLYDFSTNQQKKIFALTQRQLAHWTPDNNYILTYQTYGDGSRDTVVYSIKHDKLSILSSRNEDRYLNGMIMSMNEDLRSLFKPVIEN